MSFSQEIKSEIANQKIYQNIELIQCEVLGYILSNVGSLKSAMHFQNENKEVILRYIYMLKNCLNFVIVEDDNLQKKSKKKTQYILDIVQIEEYSDKINQLQKRLENIKTQQEKTAFVKGAFLGAGYVLNPKDNYHLEITVDSINIADMLKQYIQDLGINVKITKRKNQYVIYLKDGDNISELLILLGANVGVLKFEQERVVKEINNNVNRNINCETGNLNKIVKSANMQIQDIQYLQDNNAIGLLPQGLQDVCKIRIENPEYSLNDIANELGISKSGINNRFKKIAQIVNDIKEGRKI